VSSTKGLLDQSLISIQLIVNVLAVFRIHLIHVIRVSKSLVKCSRWTVILQHR